MSRRSGWKWGIAAILGIPASFVLTPLLFLQSDHGNRESWIGSAQTTEIVHVPETAFETGRRGRQIDRIILFTSEHPFDEAIHFWKSHGSISGHYLISGKGKIVQFVSEGDTAYHAGNLEYNHRSIGIGIEGYADPDHPENPFKNLEWQTEALLDALAGLLRDIAKRHQIALDRIHVLGKNQIPAPAKPFEDEASNPPQWGGISGRFSPGAWWNWSKLLTRLGRIQTPRVIRCLREGWLTTLPEERAPRLARVQPGDEYIAYDQCKGFLLIHLTGSPHKPEALSKNQYHWDAWIPSGITEERSDGLMARITGTFPGRTELLETPNRNDSMDPLARLTDDQWVVLTPDSSISKTFQRVHALTPQGYRSGWIRTSYLVIE